MPKILTRAGQSLADQYDTLGSNVAVEELVTSDVVLFHEMGNTLLSERMEQQLLQISADTVAQSTNFSTVHASVPDTPTRLLSVAMIATAGARVLRAALMVQDADTGREIPIFAYDSTADVETPIQWSDNGGALNTAYLLQGSNPMLQQLLVRIGDIHTMPSLILRGRTEGFGAGTVTLRCLMLVARPSGGPQGATVGLPIPSW